MEDFILQTIDVLERRPIQTTPTSCYPCLPLPPSIIALVFARHFQLSSIIK